MTRQIIDGVAYDTDMSELVCEGDDGHSLETFWWLYRTANGAWFSRISDCNGRDDWRLLSDRQARVWLEKDANSLVEKYFGRMPDVQPIIEVNQFSRRAVYAAVKVLGEGHSHGTLTEVLLGWGPEVNSRCNPGNSMVHRTNALMQFYDEDQGRKTFDGDLLSEEIVKEAVRLSARREEKSDLQSALLRALNLDGFSVRHGDIIRTLPGELELPEAENEITRLLRKHQFITLQGHLDQAFRNHSTGDWAAANSQLRCFCEGMFNEIALKLAADATSLPRSEDKRALLGKIGFFSTDLNEWSADGKNFVNGLFKRLHPEGPHPGLSDEEDSTFRRHIVLIAARLFLVRMDKTLSARS